MESTGAALSRPAGHCQAPLCPLALLPLARSHLLGLTWSTSVLLSPVVAGAWAVWEAWGPCSVSGGGGHRSRRRSCVDPPPEDGGAPAPGPLKRGHPAACSPAQVAQVRRAGLGWGHPRGGAPAAHPTGCPSPPGCGLGRVHASAELCQTGLVPPCPPSCLDPEANRCCGGHCLEGEAGPASRGAVGRALGGVWGVRLPFLPGAECPPPRPQMPLPPGLLLQDSRCLLGEAAGGALPPGRLQPTVRASAPWGGPGSGDAPLPPPPPSPVLTPCLGFSPPAVCVGRRLCCVNQGAAPWPAAGQPGPPGVPATAPVALA